MLRALSSEANMVRTTSVLYLNGWIFIIYGVNLQLNLVIQAL